MTLRIFKFDGTVVDIPGVDHKTGRTHVRSLGALHHNEKMLINGSEGLVQVRVGVVRKVELLDGDALVAVGLR